MRWLLPRSLRGRFVLIMVLGVLSAQLASYAVWTGQARDRHLEQVDELSRNVAYSIASTVRFFRSLPVEYRHIVLEQLRNMGGTRFFVSVNTARLDIRDLGESREKALVVNNVDEVLRKELGIRDAVIEFSHAEELRVFNNEVLLTDLPSRWAHYSLLMEPLSPPILVVQMELEPQQWLYVAALLPVPDLLGEQGWLSGDRMFVALVLVLTVIGLSLIGIRWVTRPLAHIARAARALGQDLEAEPIPEVGPQETVATARAFNRMQERIRRQVDERERLFSAISHDLKTPITRMRLRAEMLDDPVQRGHFSASLDELDLLVRGALASVKGMDLHENSEWVDPAEVLRSLGADLEVQGRPFLLAGEARPVRVKPVAFKRCLSNLLDNAVFYGYRAEVSLEDGEEALVIRIRDHGPGIPEAQLERVFEPYVRLERSRSRHTGGTGLGLGIARHIIRSHGGYLELRNHPDGGLEVIVELPRDLDAGGD